MAAEPVVEVRRVRWRGRRRQRHRHRVPGLHPRRCRPRADRLGDWIPEAIGTGLPLEPTFRTKSGSAVDSLSDAYADGACTTLRTFLETRG
ncbi:hypothetical protein ACFQVD_09915 [Streptosporangium amethystogenes subsp. fukuiense]|uniref:Uncharacterized protein n=1 Tax=Streptosporangium amethystogenes subsp. fukuiense TaxID=698418 RepID=A0ABW2SVV2_9ACTN